MGTSQESWEQTLLCGELTYEPRVTSVPVRLPLPPAIRQGSIYETQTLLEKSTFKKARENVGV
jgi:hypothetical protein